MNRHPSSLESPPTEPGEYMVQGFIGDCWRRLTWTGDGFYLRGFSFRQMWYRWRPVPSE